jgi:hypothetical protein
MNDERQRQQRQIFYFQMMRSVHIEILLKYNEKYREKTIALFSRSYLPIMKNSYSQLRYVFPLLLWCVLVVLI